MISIDRTISTEQFPRKKGCMQPLQIWLGEAFASAHLNKLLSMAHKGPVLNEVVHGSNTLWVQIADGNAVEEAGMLMSSHQLAAIIIKLIHVPRENLHKSLSKWEQQAANDLFFTSSTELPIFLKWLSSRAGYVKNGRKCEPEALFLCCIVACL